MSFPIDNTLHVSIDERHHLDGGYADLHFISKNPSLSRWEQQWEHKSKVFKDYIISPEAYQL